MGAKLFFEDLLPVLNSFAATEKLVHDISAAQGSIALTSLDVKGPLFKPEQWTFSLRGDVTRTTVAASVLHGPLTIHNAALRADQRELALTECRAALLDSTLAGSVTLEGYLQGLQKLRCAALGSL